MACLPFAAILRNEDKTEFVDEEIVIHEQFVVDRPLKFKNCTFRWSFPAYASICVFRDGMPKYSTAIAIHEKSGATFEGCVFINDCPKEIQQNLAVKELRVDALKVG